MELSTREFEMANPRRESSAGMVHRRVHTPRASKAARGDSEGLSVAQINAAISKLDPADLDKVKEHITFHENNGRRSTKLVGTNVLTDDELWVLQHVADFMKHIGADYTPADMLRRSQEFVPFARKVPALVEFVRKQKLNKIQRGMLLYLSFEILYEEKTKLGAACTARVIMREIHRVPALLDSQFPGYARAGMLGMAVRAHQEHKRDPEPHYVEDDD